MRQTCAAPLLVSWGVQERSRTTGASQEPKQDINRASRGGTRVWGSTRFLESGVACCGRYRCCPITCETVRDDLEMFQIVRCKVGECSFRRGRLFSQRVVSPEPLEDCSRMPRQSSAKLESALFVRGPGLRSEA